MADERNHVKKLPSINTTAYNYANGLGIRMTLDPVDKVTKITFNGETKIVRLAHPENSEFYPEESIKRENTYRVPKSALA